jgi:hypothetical protein
MAITPAQMAALNLGDLAGVVTYRMLARARSHYYPPDVLLSDYLTALGAVLL